MGITVFVVVMMPSAGEKIVHGMVSRGWTVKQIPTRDEDENNDLVETREDSFSSIVQFDLGNDPSEEQIDQAYDDLNAIIDQHEIKHYALFVGQMNQLRWSLGNLRKPSNVIQLGPYRTS
jgi:hypothetical protein